MHERRISFRDLREWDQQLDSVMPVLDGLVPRLSSREQRSVVLSEFKQAASRVTRHRRYDR